ncbi:MAG: preprotein translocase subunit SecA [Candidatus Puniceispirillales bacterium WSBS_2018_MAG_OTU23]
MFSSLAKSIFGDSNARELKKFDPIIAKIAGFETSINALDDVALKAKTDAFRTRLADGAAIDDLLPEAFATVRAAAMRTIGQRHFDVQMMGGIALHQTHIAEMKTGEGKTLVSTLAAYLNALSGKGVHVVTVNDYLAQRDSQWMGQIFRFLGLTVGCITSDLDDDQRRAAYASDITYATNNEIGFDYLRDNMKFRLEDMVQRDPHFAIIDEVDSILIDEARTPLVISGQSAQSSALYLSVDAIIPKLIAADYELDEKQRSVTLTEDGIAHVEQVLADAGLITAGTLYDADNISLLHHVSTGLKAHTLFQRDTHYMVRDGKIVIIDEFTGRAMDGRRFGDGQHQALEAKEGLEVQPENQTLASITFQNLFRMYPKLAGMTGTALTEAGEFSEIYGLDVLAIPTNNDVQRIDNDDEVYRTSDERDRAVIEQITACRERGQPVLIGTTTIEKSESLSAALTKANITHQVLNARFHEQEAMIIADAGRPKAVVIATNMAGRGTDIQLGGNLEKRIAESDGKPATVKKIADEIKAAKTAAIAAGGLYVICTERHESRRIDNQLRGRSGRQGDAGASKFFLSLEDDLMRIFGSERLDGMLQKLGLKDGEAIIHPWINKAIEKAQSKVEARNFEIRKQLLKYDDVMNDQRQVIFDQRKDIMRADEVAETISDMRHEVALSIVDTAIPDGSPENTWDAEALADEGGRYLGLDIPAAAWLAEDGMNKDGLSERLLQLSDAKMAEKAVRFGAENMRMAEKSLLLQVLDQQWKDHLLALDHMKQSVGLRSYAQKDPLNEYKREAFILFDLMLYQLRQTITSVMAHVEIRPPEAEPIATKVQSSGGASAHVGSAMMEKPSSSGGVSGGAVSIKTPRNAQCPCESGKKYKHCHGAI